MPATVVEPGSKKREGHNYNFWASKELSGALESFMGSLEYETHYKTHLEKALKEYLERKGYWPPQGVK